MMELTQSCFQELIIISGVHKSHALAHCIEGGVNHMNTVSSIQMHPRACVVCDEDAPLELRVKTVKYFKGIDKVHDEMDPLRSLNKKTAASEHPRSPTRSPLSKKPKKA